MEPDLDDRIVEALTADARHDFKAMEAAITDRTKVVLVCTPNNPTGPVVRRDELLAFLDVVPSSVLVVVDEAYREFVRETEVVDGVDAAFGVSLVPEPVFVGHAWPAR